MSSYIKTTPLSKKGAKILFWFQNNYFKILKAYSALIKLKIKQLMYRFNKKYLILYCFDKIGNNNNDFWNFKNQKNHNIKDQWWLSAFKKRHRKEN